MTREELCDRVLELFPPLAEVEPWEWAETPDGEPVVLIERHLHRPRHCAVDVTAPIPNTSKIGVWRIDPSGHYELKDLAEDPIAGAVDERNCFFTRSEKPPAAYHAELSRHSTPRGQAADQGVYGRETKARRSTSAVPCESAMRGDPNEPFAGRFEHVARHAGRGRD
jgi:hypothetical protein